MRSRERQFNMGVLELGAFAERSWQPGPETPSCPKAQKEAGRGHGALCALRKHAIWLISASEGERAVRSARAGQAGGNLQATVTV